MILQSDKTSVVPPENVQVFIVQPFHSPSPGNAQLQPSILQDDSIG